jgi:hypothetical protein
MSTPVSYEFRSVAIHGAVGLVLTRLLECAPGRRIRSPRTLGQQRRGGPLGEPCRARAGHELPENQRLLLRRGGLLDFVA